MNLLDGTIIWILISIKILSIEKKRKKYLIFTNNWVTNGLISPKSYPADPTIASKTTSTQPIESTRDVSTKV